MSARAKTSALRNSQPGRPSRAARGRQPMAASHLAPALKVVHTHVAPALKVVNRHKVHVPWAQAVSRHAVHAPRVVNRHKVHAPRVQAVSRHAVHVRWVPAVRRGAVRAALRTPEAPRISSQSSQRGDG